MYDGVSVANNANQPGANKMTTAHEELEARRKVVIDRLVVTKCKLQRNVRYVRSERHWLKITRDRKSFCFALGYAGKPQASDIDEFSFTWVANWNEAIEKAKSTIAWREI
jgi:hypothetical protein